MNRLDSDHLAAKEDHNLLRSDPLFLKRTGLYFQTNSWKKKKDVVEQIKMIYTCIKNKSQELETGYDVLKRFM